MILAMLIVPRKLIKREKIDCLNEAYLGETSHDDRYYVEDAKRSIIGGDPCLSRYGNGNP